MKQTVLRIYDFLTSHKRTAFLLLLTVGILCAVSALRMNYDEDISAFLPQGPDSRRYSAVYERLGGQDRMAVFFEGGDLDSRLDAMAAFEEIWAETDTAGLVPGLEARAGDTAVTDVLAFLSANWPYFLTEKDYARADSLLALPGYVPQRMEEDRDALYSPVSSLSSAYFRSDPLGLFSPVLGRLEALNPTGGNHLEDGFLMTPDGQAGVVFFTSPFGGSETGRNGKLVNLLETVKAKVMESCPGITVTSTGGPEVAVENARRIKKDSALALLLAAVLICIVLWLSYRRWSDVLWILLSIAAGALFALGIIALFRSSVSIIILGIGSMIIGIAVNYPLHYIDHLKYQPDKRKALAEQVNPLLIGNITTVGAFLSLLLLKAQALRDFGFIGAMMLVGTILFVLVFLPVFAPADNAPRKTLKLDLDRHVRLSGKGRTLCFLAFLCLTAVFWVLSTRISFDGDMHHINYMTPAQSRGFDLLQGLSGESDSLRTVYIVAEGADAEEALERAEAMPAGSSSILPFLPSAQTQARRISAWNAFLQRHPDLGSAVAVAASRTGFAPQAFQPFQDLLDREWTVRPDSHFAPLTQTVGQAHFLPGEDKVQIVNYLKVPSVETDATCAALRGRLPEGTFCFHSGDVSGALVGLLSEDFDTVGLICSLIVFFFLWLSFGSLELSLMSFLPLAVGWIWILGTMRLFGLQFNIVNIILATFIFGQGDDYTIFMTEGLMYEYATGKKILRSYKNAVVLSALIMFIGIGALVTARHPAMRSLGQVTGGRDHRGHVHGGGDGLLPAAAGVPLADHAQGPGPQDPPDLPPDGLHGLHQRGVLHSHAGPEHLGLLLFPDREGFGEETAALPPGHHEGSPPGDQDHPGRSVFPGQCGRRRLLQTGPVCLQPPVPFRRTGPAGPPAQVGVHDQRLGLEFPSVRLPDSQGGVLSGLERNHQEPRPYERAGRTWLFRGHLPGRHAQ